MYRRLAFHNDLLEICTNLYFQPPNNIQLKYPCIVYKVDDQYIRKAGNLAHVRMNKYRLTVIDKSPLGTIHESIIEKFPTANFVDSMVVDNLYHYTIDVHY